LTASGAPLSDRALVALEGQDAFVKVEGRGSFKISPSLKQFAEDCMQRDVHRVVLDMSSCIGMDSTFMGVLAGVATRLKKANQGEVILFNLSPRTRGLLATLGLDQLVQAYETGSCPEDLTGVTPATALDTNASQIDTARTMLEAHEKLCEVDPENRLRFKDVLTYLRDDVQKKSGQRPGTV
jgi:anti-anti-sigma factor